MMYRYYILASSILTSSSSFQLTPTTTTTAAARRSLSTFHLPAVLSSLIVQSSSHPTTSSSNSKRHPFYLQQSSISTTDSTDTMSPPIPPIAKREEERVVYAGVLPPSNQDETSTTSSNKKKDLIRQSESSTNKLLDPPRAIPDPYGWIRDESRTNEDVLNHLKAENAYTEQITNHLSKLRETLYGEMVGSIQETDYTTPALRDGKYWYYTRTNKGQSYTIYCRAPVEQDDDDSSSSNLYPKIEWDGTIDSQILPNEQVYLDVNELAKDKSYCSVSSVGVSPDTQNLLAYSVDFTGDEIYSLYVKDLQSGEIVDHDPSIECYSVKWGVDSNTLFYVKMDDAHRPYQVYKRSLKEEDRDNNKEDELIFEQPDDLYWTSIYKSSDLRYLFVSTSSSETSEVYYLDLHDESSTLKCIAKKRTKVLYDVEHFNGSWIITSNVDETPNMRLMSCPVGEHCEDQWKDMTLSTEDGLKLFDGGYDRSLDGVEAFEKYLVAAGREGGIPRIWVLEPSTTGEDGSLIDKSTQLVFDENAYDVGVGVNYDYATEKLTLYYDSLTTPLQSLQVNMNDPNNMDLRAVLKQKNVPGYEKATYGCDRITVKVRDGTEVPVSMVYRNDVMEKFVNDGSTVPVHLVGYGSYGACSEADFSATRLPLLNRGIVYVVAHIRGGKEVDPVFVFFLLLCHLSSVFLTNDLFVLQVVKWVDNGMKNQMEQNTCVKRIHSMIFVTLQLG